jgi:uncharacterized Tic20 family protein
VTTGHGFGAGTLNPMAQQAPPGWYSDPHRPGTQRWWDGTKWGDQTMIATSSQQVGPSDARTWAMVAHLSALIGLAGGIAAFVGPLVVYLVKRDSDPFIRDQAAEALNFNLSVLLYAVIFGVITFVLFIVLVGVFLIPLWIIGAIAWFVFVILGAVAASRGERYRYPLTIRFVS